MRSARRLGTCKQDDLWIMCLAYQCDTGQPARRHAFDRGSNHDIYHAAKRGAARYSLYKVQVKQDLGESPVPIETTYRKTSTMMFR